MYIITTVTKLFSVISGAYSDSYVLAIFVTLEFDHVIHVAYLLDCHFTGMCLVTWPMNASEAGGDLTFIQTSLLFLF